MAGQVEKNTGFERKQFTHEEARKIASFAQSIDGTSLPKPIISLTFGTDVPSSYIFNTPISKRHYPAEFVSQLGDVSGVKFCFFGPEDPVSYPFQDVAKVSNLVREMLKSYRDIEVSVSWMADLRRGLKPFNLGLTDISAKSLDIRLENFIDVINERPSELFGWSVNLMHKMINKEK